MQSRGNSYLLVVEVVVVGSFDHFFKISPLVRDGGSQVVVKNRKTA